MEAFISFKVRLPTLRSTIANNRIRGFSENKLSLILEFKNSSTAFFITYNIGLILSVIMMAIRGCVEVLNLEISSMIDSSISGIAGISHIIMTIAYILFFLMLLNRINDADSKK